MQIVNPIFPLNEYIPDGEPHVFGDRVYLFGSHDMEGGNEYCMLDYVCYSAAVDNLKEWKYEGVIYQADRDPAYGENRKYMYAPDVVQGPDGRYYLYYCLLGQHLIKVAVCDTPAGDYQYYGIVQGEDGKPLTRFIPGDPGVINDDGRIYLYYGWSLALPPEHKTALPMTEESPMYENMIQLQMMMFDKSRDEVVGEKEGVMGANVVELKEDMLTTVTEPKRIVPGQFNASGDFTAVAVYFNLETTAQFDSSNKLPNQFVENTLWSAKNNSADVPTDCPTRERHGWTGDRQLFAVTAGYLK